MQLETTGTDCVVALSFDHSEYALSSAAFPVGLSQ
jgi:hypothetical protein